MPDNRHRHLVTHVLGPLALWSGCLTHPGCCSFVSRPDVGLTKGSSDRQFLFINGRPVDLPKAGASPAVRCSVLRCMFIIMLEPFDEHICAGLSCWGVALPLCRERRLILIGSLGKHL